MYNLNAMRPTVDPISEPLAWQSPAGNPLRYFPIEPGITADQLPNINATVPAGKYVYRAILWRPGMPVLKSNFLALDTETELLIKGAVKRPVLLQVCSHVDRTIHLVWWTEMDQYIKESFASNPNTIWIMHNAPFDLDMLGYLEDDKPYLMNAVEECRIIDTSIRFFLRQLDKGLFCPDTKLKTAVKQLLNEDMEKDGDIRLTFKQNEIPSKEHILYAAKDAAYTAQLVYESMTKWFPTEPEQLKGAIALYDIGDRGFLVDTDYMDKKREELTALRDVEAEILSYWGYFRGYPGNKAILQEVVKWIERQLGITLPRTDGGDVSTDKEAMKIIAATPHPFTQAYSKFVGYDKVIGTYLRANTDHDAIMEVYDKQCLEAEDAAYRINLEIDKENERIRLKNLKIQEKNIDKKDRGIREQKLVALKKHKKPKYPPKPKLEDNLIGVDGRMHAYFKPMVRTGRTSCSGPNLQNLPRDGGIRGQYIAPSGYVFFQCDYSQLELCALAQHCYINYELKGQLKECVMRRVINEGQDLHMWFGRKIYEASNPDILWDDLPKKETKGILGKKDYRQMAKACNFGFPGGLGIPKFREYALNTYGVDLEEEQARMLKDLWIDSFPEMEYHLKPVPDPKWDGKADEDGQIQSRFIAQTTGGRRRANSSFCSACNYPFQGLASDGAKAALWKLFKERFRVVDFIHDEVIVELLEDESLEKNRLRIEQLMVEAMQEVCPDVMIQVEGSMMKRWYKEAEPVFDDNGCMAIWYPPEHHKIAV